MPGMVRYRVGGQRLSPPKHHLQEAVTLVRRSFDHRAISKCPKEASFHFNDWPKLPEGT